MISRTRTVFLAISIVCAYIVWGALISLQPPFYPTEAEKKGATPAQVSTEVSDITFKWVSLN